MKAVGRIWGQSSKANGRKTKAVWRMRWQALTLMTARWRQWQGYADKAHKPIAARQRQYIRRIQGRSVRSSHVNGCKTKAVRRIRSWCVQSSHTCSRKTKTSRRIHGWSLHTRSPEKARGPLLLESFGNWWDWRDLPLERIRQHHRPDTKQYRRIQAKL